MSLAYTLDEPHSSYNATTVKLVIYLPGSLSNYDFTPYDVSQEKGGTIKNVIFLYMKKKGTDPGLVLADTSNVVSYSFPVSSLNQTISNKFDVTSGKTLVIVFHDSTAVISSILSYGSYYYGTDLHTLFDDIDTHGERQDDYPPALFSHDDKAQEEFFDPKKVGLSIVIKSTH